MSQGTMTTDCPAMGVRPTTQSVFRPFAPRLTDNLPSPSRMDIADIITNWRFDLTFPPTFVRYNWSGEMMRLPDGTDIIPDWIVDACTAYAGDKEDPWFTITYGREACVMDAGHLMHALPVNGEGAGRLPNSSGTRIKIYSRLPEVLGDPAGQWWQFRKPWIMRKTEVDSRVVVL